MPFVLADERRAVLAYLVQQTEIGEMSKESLAVKEDFREEVAIVRLNRCKAHMLGPPNDEAFSGHPLASRGLRPYGVFRIEDSSWIRELERSNSVHPRHSPERYRQLQHLVFAFHDSTFECVCVDFDFTTTKSSDGYPIVEMLAPLKSR
jgi:hypothetical protein